MKSPSSIPFATASIVSGAVAERIKIWPFFIFAAVMAGISDYTAEQLDGELMDLHATYISLGWKTSVGVDGFLEELRSRAALLEQQQS